MVYGYILFTDAYVTGIISVRQCRVTVESRSDMTYLRRNFMRMSFCFLGNILTVDIWVVGTLLLCTHRSVHFTSE